jgi:hypothetical protein
MIYMHLVAGNIECPGMFHCPNSHCIPYRKLCDGFVDCPGGQDEENCGLDYICPGKIWLKVIMKVLL